MRSHLVEFNASTLACWHETAMSVDVQSDRLVLAPGAVTGGLTTCPVDVRNGFHRAVLSWNIRERDHSAYTTEIRIQTTRGEWTSWLSPRHESPPELPSGVALHIDEIHSRPAAYRFQVRLSLNREDPSLPGPEVARVCVSTRRIPRNGTLIPRDHPTPTAVQSAPFLNQYDQHPEHGHRLCSPTCTAMVIQARGVKASVDRVAKLSFHPGYDLYGVWPMAVQAAYQYGVPGRVEYLTTWSEVRRRLRAGCSIVASISFREGELEQPPYSGTDGHLVLLLGVDEEGRPITHDPRLPAEEGAGLKWNPADFSRAWFGHGGAAYVFDPPGRTDWVS